MGPVGVTGAGVAVAKMQSETLKGIPTRRGPARTIVSRLLRDRSGRTGVAIVVLLVGAALLAPMIAPNDPLAIGVSQPFAAPSAAHPFGADDLGRDVLSRVLYGARISLRIAVFSIAIALAIAAPLGAAAGSRGGWSDSLIARIFDTIFAFPAILIGVGFVAVFGTSVRNVVFAVAIVNVPTLGRLMRVAFLAQRHQEYVIAARALGASGWRIDLGHILPNALPPMVVQVALAMGEAVLLEAAFSFLGLGSQPPAPSWGTMLNEGRRFLAQAPWLGIFPGLAITLMIFGLNALGDGLRRALNPRHD